MDIKRSGSQPSGKGPAEYFTGTVRIDPLFEAPDPARTAGRTHLNLAKEVRRIQHFCVFCLIQNDTRHNLGNMPI